MRFILFFILYSFRTISGDVCDEKKCPNYAILTHYRELECVPVYDTKNGDKCCPIAYDCPLLARLHKNPNICYLNGIEYAVKQKVPSEVTSSICAAECRCSANSDFSCAEIECPENFPRNTQKSDCYKAYDLNHCCSVGKICPVEGKFVEKPCTINGETHRHGEKFGSKDDEFETCACKNGQVECRQLNCGTQLRHARAMANGAAPKYYGYERFCPIEYFYPSANDKVIAKNQNDSLPKCKFGNLTANIGDEITTSETNDATKCTCLVPPSIICIQSRPI